MKKLLISLCLLLCLPVLSLAAEQNMIDSVLTRGVLRVGFSSFVPWAMQNKSGEFVGFEIDVARRLAKDLGVKIELIPTRWAGIVPALLTNKFDIIIGGMGITPERNLKVNFTIPYDYSTIEAVANREKTKNMVFPDDYNNEQVVIAIRSGSTAIIPAKQLFPKAQFRLFDDEAPAVQEVIAGRAHLLFASAPLPAFEVLKNSTALVQPSKEALASQPVGFAINKNDFNSLNVLDGWIRMVEAEGWLKERKNYWFNSTAWDN